MPLQLSGEFHDDVRSGGERERGLRDNFVGGQAAFSGCNEVLVRRPRDSDQRHSMYACHSSVLVVVCVAFAVVQMNRRITSHKRVES